MASNLGSNSANLAKNEKNFKNLRGRGQILGLNHPELGHKGGVASFCLIWVWLQCGRGLFLKGPRPILTFCCFLPFFGRFLAVFGRFSPNFLGRGSLGWAWLAGHALLS